MEEKKITYNVNGVEFDKAEDAVEHIKEISKQSSNKEKEDILAQLKDSYKKTAELIEKYNDTYTSEQDRKDLYDALGIFDDLDAVLDKMFDALTKELGFDGLDD